LLIIFQQSLITIFFDYKKPFPLSRHREFLPSRHCEPKGWQVCWREAISLLHIPVGVKCFEEIASPDCHQARNDERGYSLAMTPLSVIARAQPEAISSLLIPFSVKCFEGIASLTAFARNDVVGLQTCNDVTKTLLIALQRS